MLQTSNWKMGQREQEKLDNEYEIRIKGGELEARLPIPPSC
jgi:hypothetical protein